MGAPKPLARLGGAPLTERPLAAAREAGLDAVVVAKADTPLPDGVHVWHEPDEPVPARYEPAWLPQLRTALEREASMRATLDVLGPATIEWDGAALRSLDTPGDLAAAQDEIVGRRR
jgi:molybdopterin-guanine dinucleotide biosynthesis protein A